MNRPQGNYEESNRDHRDQRSNGQGSGNNNQHGHGHHRHHHQSQYPYQRNWSNQSNNYRNSNRPPPTNRGCYQIESSKVASFYVHPHSMYKGQFPSVSQPVEVGVVLSDKRRVNLETKLNAKQPNASDSFKEQVLDRNYGIKYLGKTLMTISTVKILTLRP